MYVDDATRLRHVRDAAREAVLFAQGRRRSDLDIDRMLMHSLVRCIEIIGEASSRITEARRSATPGIPWPQVVGMRHRIVHEDFQVDLDVVWDTVTRDLPPLIASLDETRSTIDPPV